MYSKEFLDKMHKHLLAAKAKLEDNTNHAGARPELDVESQDDVSEELEVEAVSQGLKEEFQEDLLNINEALDKFADSSYGKCEVGGEFISEARLEALPWAKTCIEHES
jgi:RNA polymerase-binding transcription factor DksA